MLAKKAENKCSADRIGPYSFNEYVEIVKSFHGRPAPGVLIGGYMVQFAFIHCPEGELFDAICETRCELPDAVQLLTPCTLGNTWLQVIDLGRFALTLYEKHQGEGARAYVEPAKLDLWPEIRSWYFNRNPGIQPDADLLMDQIRNAGSTIFGIQKVVVKPQLVHRGRRGRIAMCPDCGEAYPAKDGKSCRGCRGESPYLLKNKKNNFYRSTHPSYFNTHKR